MSNRVRRVWTACLIFGTAVACGSSTMRASEVAVRDFALGSFAQDAGSGTQDAGSATAAPKAEKKEKKATRAKKSKKEKKEKKEAKSDEMK
jgi:hypothetical protein